MLKLFKKKQVESLGDYQTASPEIKPEPTTDQPGLYLINSGRTKMAVIKAIREINPNLMLKEAKAVADKGGLVLSGTNQAIIAGKDKLEAVGATVEIKL